MDAVRKAYSEWIKSGKDDHVNFISASVQSIRLGINKHENTQVGDTDEEESADEEILRGDVNAGFAVPDVAGLKRKNAGEIATVRTRRNGYYGAGRDAETKNSDDFVMKDVGGEPVEELAPPKKPQTAKKTHTEKLSAQLGQQDDTGVLVGRILQQKVEISVGELLANSSNLHKAFFQYLPDSQTETKQEGPQKAGKVHVQQVVEDERRSVSARREEEAIYAIDVLKTDTVISGYRFSTLIDSGSY